MALASVGIAEAQTRIDRTPSPRRAAGPQAPPREIIETPIWTQRAVQDEIVRAYPAGAREAKLEGAAQLTCEATTGGRVQKCVVAGEAPAGAGFGEAALKLAGRYRMGTLDGDRNPVGGRKVSFQIAFAPGYAYQAFAADPGSGLKQNDATAVGGK